MVKLGIIGMGNMGSKYAHMLLEGEVDGAELVAVTRIHQERLEKLTKIIEQNIPIFQSAEELFAAVENGTLLLDAVIIATPHLTHEAQTIRALELGLHVLCDKPSSVFSKQARRMNEVAQGKTHVFSMMFNQRTNPVYQRMKEIVESGQYGALKRVNWVITDWYRPNAYYDTDTWRGTWKGDGGGILLNQCPHNLDLLQWICGMPVRVQAFCKEGKYHQIEVEDEVTAYMEFDNGATGTFYSTTGEAPGMNRLEISLEDALLVCEKGMLRVCELGFHEAVYRQNATEYFAKLNGTWKDINCPGENTMHCGIIQNFVNCVLKKEMLLVNGSEGLKSLLLSNAMYLSSWQKRMVELPQSVEEQLFLEEAFQKGFEERMNYYEGD